MGSVALYDEKSTSSLMPKNSAIDSITSFLKIGINLSTLYMYAIFLA